jgi:ATP-dependent DNA helicase RecG
VSPDDIQYLKGVGPKRAKVLIDEGFSTPLSLIFNFPRDYIDRAAAANLKTILNGLKNDLFASDEDSPNKIVTVVAKVYNKELKRLGRNRTVLKLKLHDGSGANGTINFWSRASFFEKIYHVGSLLAVSGKAEYTKFDGVVFTHPEIDLISPEDEELYSSGKILPVYRLSEKMRNSGLNMRAMRKISAAALENSLNEIQETLPANLLQSQNFPSLRVAAKTLHFPESKSELENARRRMKFEELFYYILSAEIKRSGIKLRENAPEIERKSPLARKLFENLPFELTTGQKKALWDIAGDFESGRPMNRLLQGDVGSGKTVVAVLSLLMAIDSGYQAVFMAPTEILAEQHYITLKNWLEPLNISTVILTGGTKGNARKEILEAIESGKAQIVVGTHALFQERLTYKKLAYAVIDEQHRFGVEQRAALKFHGEKSFGGKKITPHILVMTATPIPRTLTMTVYGDLEVSLIKTKPKNRLPIKTRVTFDSSRNEVFNFLRDNIRDGGQAYVVFPLVEKSDKLELKAAKEHYEELSGEIFPDLKLGLLHGQMKTTEKDMIMLDFKSGKYDILVATTVIEVGIDVPNANIMLIENAERFGLSQLHQLRGRVGRGKRQSYCILMADNKYRGLIRSKNPDESRMPPAVTRLRTMEQTGDGFKIAEVDMQLRGPGDVLGTKQSGLPDFKFANLVEDLELISLIKQITREIVEKDPQFEHPENAIISEFYKKMYKSGKNYFDIA